MLAHPSALVVINPIVQQSWLALNNAEEGGAGRHAVRSPKRCEVDAGKPNVIVMMMMVNCKQKLLSLTARHLHGMVLRTRATITGLHRVVEAVLRQV